MCVQSAQPFRTLPLLLARLQQTVLLLLVMMNSFWHLVLVLAKLVDIKTEMEVLSPVINLKSLKQALHHVHHATIHPLSGKILFILKR